MGAKRCMYGVAPSIEMMNGVAPAGGVSLAVIGELRSPHKSLDLDVAISDNL